MLADLQSRFAKGLLDPDVAPPDELADRLGRDVARRYGIYRNNVVVSLVEALMDAFPAVLRIVGEEFFRGAAGVYVRADPPTSPILLEYGSGFADFLAGFEPAVLLPYLADVARLETAYVRAHHAADEEVMDATILQSLTPDQLTQARLVPHASTQVVRSAYPIHTIWHLNAAADNDPTGPITEGAQDVLVCRPVFDVETHTLPAGAAAFLSALAEDASLAVAVDEANRDNPAFDLAKTLTCLLETGALHDCLLAADK